jgi:endonuclease/exonuclease/phosphatase family metal-dependent hydrolase
MRVVSWNMHGAPAGATNRQLERAWHHLAALDADLVLLQEVRHSVVPAWVHEVWSLQLGVLGAHGKTGNWGSGIAAKPTLNMRPREDLLESEPWLATVYDYVVVAEIDLGSTPAFVASVHAPAMPASEMLDALGKPGEIDANALDAIRIEPDPSWSTDVIFHALNRVKGGRFIIGGDWNCSRLFDRDKNVPTNALFFSRAYASNWIELLGKVNEERSFFRTGNLPYQLDHVFVDRKTERAVKSRSVWADASALEVSDHAPIVADIVFEA